MRTYFFDMKGGVPSRDRTGLEFSTAAGAIEHSKQLSTRLRRRVRRKDQRASGTREFTARPYPSGWLAAPALCRVAAPVRVRHARCLDPCRRPVAAPTLACLSGRHVCRLDPAHLPDRSPLALQSPFRICSSMRFGATGSSDTRADRRESKEKSAGDRAAGHLLRQRSWEARLSPRVKPRCASVRAGQSATAVNNDRVQSPAAGTH